MVVRGTDQPLLGLPYPISPWHQSKQLLTTTSSVCLQPQQPLLWPTCFCSTHILAYTVSTYFYCLPWLKIFVIAWQTISLLYDLLAWTLQQNNFLFTPMWSPIYHFKNFLACNRGVSGGRGGRASALPQYLADIHHLFAILLPVYCGDNKKWLTSGIHMHIVWCCYNSTCMGFECT